MNKILLAISFLAFGSSCQQKSKKTASEVESDVKSLVEKAPGINAGTGTYTVNAIDGWTKTDTVFSGMEMTLLRSKQEGPGDGFVENINIVTEKAPGNDLDKFFNDNVSGISGQLPGYEKKEEGSSTINNEKCYRLVYSHSYTGTPIDVEAYFFVKNGNGYVISCSTEKGKLDKWKPSFDKIVNTFAIN